VHVATIPDANEEVIDRHLEERMAQAEKVVMLVRAMRMKSNLKVRQPLRRIILPIANEQDREIIRRVESVILDEINVKTIEYVTDDSGIVKKSAKANFKAIGPRFGKSVQQVAQRIKQMDVAEISRLESAGSLDLPVNGSMFTIHRDDVEILREDIPGWLVESDGSLTVALDTGLTEELIAEGVGREFVNRVQNMRKSAGFVVTDRIAIFYSGTDRFHHALQTQHSYVRNETLAVELSPSFQPGEYTEAFDVNGEQVKVGIERRSQG
jgi:isoleucyl-tRNA synthetase